MYIWGRQVDAFWDTLIKRNGDRKEPSQGRRGEGRGGGSNIDFAIVFWFDLFFVFFFLGGDGGGFVFGLITMRMFWNFIESFLFLGNN